jgi:hypothetical protein
MEKVPVDTGMHEAVTRREVLPKWLTPGVWGIGLASFLADVGHEVPTALFASFVTVTLGAPAAILGLIEGLADGLAGLARLTGGALADDPHKRRTTALGGYLSTAALAALIGVAGAVWQAALLRIKFSARASSCSWLIITQPLARLPPPHFISAITR